MVWSFRNARGRKPVQLSIFMSWMFFMCASVCVMCVVVVFAFHSFIISFAAILEGAFPTNMPLQHMQKDLKLSLSMGDQLEQPLPVSAAANEVYKHAKRLGYADHDVSAVYIRARFWGLIY